MSILSAAIVIQLASACSGPPVPPPRVAAHAMVESSFQTTAIHDNATNKSYTPATVAEAVGIARELLKQGHRIDAGLMQVTDSNWTALGLTVETVFDPQANVCAGRTVLAEAYAIERAVSCRYNTGKPVCGGAYPAKVETAMEHVEPAPVAAAPAPVEVTVVSRPLVGRPPAWDVYASANAGRGTRAIALATKE